MSETRRDNLMHALGLTSSFGIDGIENDGADGAEKDGMEGASNLGACARTDQRVECTKPASRRVDGAATIYARGARRERRHRRHFHLRGSGSKSHRHIGFASLTLHTHSEYTGKAARAAAADCAGRRRRNQT